MNGLPVRAWLLGVESVSLEPGERHALDAALRLHRLPELTEPIERAFAGLLLDSESRIRAAAVRFFVVRGSADDHGALLRAAERLADFVGFSEPWHGGPHDLALLLRMAIGSRVGRGHQYERLAKQTLLAPGLGTVGLRPILVHDPEWVGANVPAILHGTPGALASLGRIMARMGLDVRDLFRVGRGHVAEDVWEAAVAALPADQHKQAVMAEFGLLDE